MFRLELIFVLILPYFYKSISTFFQFKLFSLIFDFILIPNFDFKNNFILKHAEKKKQSFTS